MLFVEIPPRDIERDAALARQPLEIILALAVGLGLPWTNGAAAQGLAVIRDHQAVVDADDAAEAAAGLAGADRRIERETARRRFAIGDVAAGAVQRTRVAPGFAHVVPGRILQDMHMQPAAADAQRGFQRLGESSGVGAGGPQPVLHDFDRLPAARADARVALLLEQRQHFAVLEILRYRDVETDERARIAGCSRPLLQIAADALGRVAADDIPAASAVQMRAAREQQLEMVVELGHRADGRARGAHRIRLVDGDRWRNALDAVHRRLVHAVEELPRVRREGFHVAPLAFGVQRVEHQRRLSRTGHTGDHDEFAGRDLEVEVLQVVLAGAANDDRLMAGIAHERKGVWGKAAS